MTHLLKKNYLSFYKIDLVNCQLKWFKYQNLSFVIQNRNCQTIL